MTAQAAGPLLLAAIALALPLTRGALEHAGTRSFMVRSSASQPLAVPASDAVRAGNMLYLGAHMGLDPRTGRPPPDSAAEARLLMDLVQHTVTSAGLRMDDLVSVTVISTDCNLNGAFDAVYRTYFHSRYPARGFVGATALAGGAHFELLGVAIKPPLLQL
jgi:2-iminobutanoate/2-iminopropanoate deaminase